MIYNLETVADNIKSARLFRNYSQDYLAFKLNISQNGYSKIELGYTRLSVERLIKIAEVLEVNLTSLLEITDIREEVKAISHMEIVPKILEIICHTTGMGFAAVARVTDEQWIACSIRDEINFGLKPGDELKLETTICNEIRQSGKEVIIDEVSKDPLYTNHLTPALYGFQSYISIPINRKNGNFFGTLCAIDPKPAKLNRPETINMFRLFADLISFHLHSIAFDQSRLPMNEKHLN